MTITAAAQTLIDAIAAYDTAVASAQASLDTARANRADAITAWRALWRGVGVAKITTRGTPIYSDLLAGLDTWPYTPAVGNDQARLDSWTAVENADAAVAAALPLLNTPAAAREVLRTRLAQIPVGQRGGPQ